MAYEIPGFSFSLPSAADYSTGAGQFRFVTVDGNGKAVHASAAGPAIGVRQNLPGANVAMTIMTSGVSKVEAGETVAAGEYVKSMADGKAGDADTAADDILGICLEGGANGELITVLLRPVPIPVVV